MARCISERRMKGYKFVVTDMSIRSNAIDVISSLEVGAKTIWEVIIQPKKKSRTETQNRTYWRWVGEISLEISKIFPER